MKLIKHLLCLVLCFSFFISVILLLPFSVILDAYTDIDIDAINQTVKNHNFIVSNSFKTFYYPNKRIELVTNPNYNSLIMGYLWIGDKVEVVAQNDDWYAINYNGNLAYILKKNDEIINIPVEKLETQSTPSSSSTPSQTINIVGTDEHLYVQPKILNVRKGPGTQYEKIGELSQNDRVHRIGYVSTGWSKIEYANQTAYVYSTYLSNTKVEEPKSEPKIEQETVLEEMERRGSMGRLYIPSCGLSVALFKSSLYDINHSQRTVDDKDSAAYLPDEYKYWGFVMIADHVHQGFSAIKKAIPNKTIADIDYGTYVDKYICTKVFIGKNIGYDLVDLQGVSIAGKNDNGIVMYTCNIDGTITITFWQPC